MDLSDDERLFHLANTTDIANVQFSRIKNSRTGVYGALSVWLNLNSQCIIKPSVGIWAGNTMRSRTVTRIAALSVLAAIAVVPALAAPAQQLSVKIGYFNLALVKASFPEAAGGEALRVQAENQLRRDVEEGNKSLQKLQEDKKPKEEIEKRASQLQTEINAKQRALIELVQTQQALANQTIAQTVASVAKEKGLDVVVDGSGVFSGGDKIVNSGEDITDAIVRKLAPATLRPGGGSAPAATPASAPAAGK